MFFINILEYESSYIKSFISDFFGFLPADHTSSVLEMRMINIELTGCLCTVQGALVDEKWMIDPPYPCITTLGKSDRSYVPRYTVCNISHSWYMCWLHKVPHRESQHSNIISEIFQDPGKISSRTFPRTLVIVLNISYLPFLIFGNKINWFEQRLLMI